MSHLPSHHTHTPTSASRPASSIVTPHSPPSTNQTPYLSAISPWRHTAAPTPDSTTSNHVNQDHHQSMSPSAPLRPTLGEYVMSFYMGTPPIKRWAIIDSGSSLLWVQCEPCVECCEPLKAIKKDSSFASKVKTIVILGGAFLTSGSMNPAAEANIYADPDAADVMFTSGANIDIVGINITTQVVLTDADLAELKASNGRHTQIISDMGQFYRDWHVKSEDIYDFDGIDNLSMAWNLFDSIEQDTTKCPATNMGFPDFQDGIEQLLMALTDPVSERFETSTTGASLVISLDLARMGPIGTSSISPV